MDNNDYPEIIYYDENDTNNPEKIISAQEALSSMKRTAYEQKVIG